MTGARLRRHAERGPTVAGERCAHRNGRLAQLCHVARGVVGRVELDENARRRARRNVQLPSELTKVAHFEAGLRGAVAQRRQTRLTRQRRAANQRNVQNANT